MNIHSFLTNYQSELNGEYEIETEDGGVYRLSGMPNFFEEAGLIQIPLTKDAYTFIPLSKIKLITVFKK